jgi:hypothetical protein
VKVAAKGLVPRFEELFDFAPAGYKIEETTDSGPAVQKLDSEGEELVAATERDWLIKLVADRSDSSAAAFSFPKPKDDTMKVAYKRYEDADIVDVQPELALAGVPLRKSPWWPWALSAARWRCSAGLWCYACASSLLPRKLPLLTSCLQR